MRCNLEIEFKTAIDKETYDKMIEKFDLKETIFKQTNYYFDTENNDLIKNKIVLRIRQKEAQYKLTSKTHTQEGALEKHLFLINDEAQEMLQNGFNANKIGINYYVKNVASLTTYRAKTEYKGGFLFFDKSIYYGNTDYEIEYEATNKDEGIKIFEEFLNENNIPFVKMISKAKRAYNAK